MRESNSSAAPARIAFGPFVLDGPEGCLWREGKVVALRRKAWEVLYRLASRRGEVHANADLLRAVWGDVAISPQVLTNAIREIRTALDDTVDPPRFVRTIRGRGYVFLADVHAFRRHARPDVVVGRDAELRRLAEIWDHARAGRSRLCFVTGEPGIGKTTLVDTFLAHCCRESAVAGPLAAHGVCAEQHGRGEAYMPLLEAIDELLDAPEFPDALKELRRCAPAWLAQLPWRLGRDDERVTLAQSLTGMTTPRMLQQGIAFLRTAAARRSLVLVLEDVHWSDLATLDLLAALARRPVAAPLLILATYRRVDAADRAHPVVPLALELARSGAAEELALGPLDGRAAGNYVAARFASAELAFALADRLTEQSAGNPLFMRTLIDELVARGAILRGADGWHLAGGATKLDELPKTLREFVGAELDTLPPPVRDVVEAASVSELAFTAPELAAAIAADAPAVERTCERLVKRGRLLRVAADVGGDVDGGAPAGVRRYAFVHAAYRRFVYEQIAPLTQRSLHRGIAAALAAARPNDEDGVAGRVAMHYARGGDSRNAIAYFDRAATYAERHSAYRESAAHLRAALDQAAAGATTVPAERIGAMQLRVAGLLSFVESYGAMKVGDALAAARDAFAARAAPQGQFMAELGIGRYELVRGRHDAALPHVARILEMSATVLQPLRAVACCWAGFAASLRGELARACALFEEGLAAPEAPGLLRDMDAHRLMGSQSAIVLGVRGDLAGGRARAEAALERARGNARPGDLTQALLLETERATFLRDHDVGRVYAAETIRMAHEAGLPSFLVLARFYQALFDTGRPAARIAAMREAIVERRRLGDRWHESLLLTLLAETELEAGDVESARATIDAARGYVAESNERHYLAEVQRVQGESRCAVGDADAAANGTRLLADAVETAAGQGARLLALRAATSLARHARDGGAAGELVRHVEVFPSAVESWDLKEARAVLAASPRAVNVRGRRRP